jgi:alpha-galactosidase
MPVHTINNGKYWILKTSNTAYTLGIGPGGNLQHCYWGGDLPYPEDFPDPAEPVNREESHPFDSTEERVAEEAPPWGKIRYKEPVFKISYADETRSLDLEYEDFKILEPDKKGEGLLITLRDPTYNLTVELEDRLVEAEDLIERSTTITNDGSEPITIEQALSGQFTLPSWDEYNLTHLAGHWGGETNVKKTRLTQGQKVIDSRRGTTSHQHNPWFAVDSGDAGEHDGEVYFGALAYSGNWKLVFEKNPYDELRVSGGIHDFDFEWRLEAGESFQTPTFVGGYSENGFGGASRNLHSYQRAHILPDDDPTELRPILYNSWYATEVDVQEAHQKRLAERAAELECELFVVDAGWYKNAVDFATGLGDWQVDEEKFPNGLGSLINHVNDLGMDFGLWVEPENVNRDSDLYREHPDWVYHFPNREQQSINHERYVLNFAKDEVREYMYEAMDRLLTEYDIDFIKWDMNRHFSEPGWPEAPEGRNREIWVRHTRAVYEIFDRLGDEYPGVIFETCSGGGGRADMGILSRTHQAWTSDNVDPFDRLFIQEGYSHAYAPKSMENWVTDPWESTGRETSLEYTFHVAMMGSMGIGADLTEWSDDQMQTAAELVEDYKEVRPVVQNGNQYRLRSPRESELSAVEYVSQDRDEAVVFTFLHSRRYSDEFPPLHLHGLVKDARYRVEGLGEERTLSGRALHKRGIDIDLRGDFQSNVVRLTRVE